MDNQTKELHSNHGIGQLNSAVEIHQAIALSPEIQADITLSAVRETDVFRLRRGLCLPSAAATNINSLLHERRISEERSGSSLALSDLFKAMFKYHNKIGLMDKEGNVFDKPWLAVSEQGDVYHQAIVAIAQGFGINAMAIGNFPDLDLLVNFVKAGGKVALSLDNKFVLDNTLGNDPRLVRTEDQEQYILIEGEDGIGFRKFEQGRHVVSVLDIQDDGKIIVHDSFSLPQQNEPHGVVIEIGKDILEQYLIGSNGSKSRAILFSTDAAILEPLRQFESRVFIPKDLVEDVHKIASTT
jgi:hypothetical protein